MAPYRGCGVSFPANLYGFNKNTRKFFAKQAVDSPPRCFMMFVLGFWGEGPGLRKRFQRFSTVVTRRFLIFALKSQCLWSHLAPKEVIGDGDGWNMEGYLGFSEGLAVFVCWGGGSWMQFLRAGFWGHFLVDMWEVVSFGHFLDFVCLKTDVEFVASCRIWLAENDIETKEPWSLAGY